jgi:hypothetical protein
MRRFPALRSGFSAAEPVVPLVVRSIAGDSAMRGQIVLVTESYHVRKRCGGTSADALIELAVDQDKL